MKGRSLTRVPSKHKCLSIFYEWPSRSIKEESGYQGCPVSGPSSELMRHLQGWEQLLEWASIDSFRATTKLLPNIIHLSTVMVGDGSPIWIFMEKKGEKKHCPQWRNDLGGAVREENDTAGLKSNSACSNGAVDCWLFSTHDFLYWFAKVFKNLGHGFAF